MGLARTSIDWCDYSWNPTSGCSHGCEWCYAARMAGRFGHSFAPICHPERLDLPLRTRKPGRVFVDSNGDLFDPAIPDGFIWQIFNEMRRAHWHTFIILTKQVERMNRWFDFIRLTVDIGGFPWPLPNVHLGVSVTSQADADERIPRLLETPAAVRFVSAEPLLGPVDLYAIRSHPLGCEGLFGCEPKLRWLIVGALTGPGAKPPKREWVQDIVEQCREVKVPIFLKENLKPVWQGELIQEYPEAERG